MPNEALSPDRDLNLAGGITLDQLLAQLDVSDRIVTGPDVVAGPWPPGDTTLNARVSGAAYGSAADEMARRITMAVPDWEIVPGKGSWLAVAPHRLAAIRLSPGATERGGIEVTGYRFRMSDTSAPSVITSTCLARHAGPDDLFCVIDILRAARILPTATES